MDINSLITLIMPPLLTACFAVGAAGWHLAKNWIEARMPSNILSIVESIVTNVIHSIESQYEGAAGEDKKTAALNQVAQILQSMHLNVSPALLSSSIDFAVQQMNANAAAPAFAALAQGIANMPAAQLHPTQAMPIVQPPLPPQAPTVPTNPVSQQ